MSRHRTRSVATSLTALGTLLLGACASTSAPVTVEPGDIDFQVLDAELEAWAADARGGAVGLVRLADGQTHFIEVGEDATTGALLAAENRIRVGSISKVYTATLVLQLVDDGLVELDEPVVAYLPDTSINETITVRHLLGHRSGLPNYTEQANLMQPSIDMATLQFEPETIVSSVADEQDFAPGTNFSYSNTNYIVAGQLIEAVTGVTLNGALQEQINEPLGLTDTVFDDGSVDGVASGYSLAIPEGASGNRNYQSIAELAWAAGAITTTPEELATFLDALLIEGQLLSDQALEDMQPAFAEGGEYGLGLAIGTDFGIGHDGSIFGFNSSAQLDPESGEMLILIVNNDARRPSVATELITDLAGID